MGRGGEGDENKVTRCCEDQTKVDVERKDGCLKRKDGKSGVDGKEALFRNGGSRFIVNENKQREECRISDDGLKLQERGDRKNPVLFSVSSLKSICCVLEVPLRSDWRNITSQISILSSN